MIAKGNGILFAIASKSKKRAIKKKKQRTNTKKEAKKIKSDYFWRSNLGAQWIFSLTVYVHEEEYLLDRFEDKWLLTIW